ncbi:MAG: HNH endonuclease [Candidatus Marinimicrobia bacterium]|nr:HNH endonuclease [Candidatus Neomarinimicrobiota bacterium]
MNPSVLNQKVLILNQNYQPIMITGAKRAILLQFLDKVEVLEHYGDWVHSPNLSIQIPSVIKLKVYTRYIRGNISLSKKNILQRDKYTCQYCGKRNIPMTLDHVVPRGKGGKDIWENLVTACIHCNNKKGNLTPRESGLQLMTIPRKPSFVFYFQQFVNNKQEKWRPYVFMGSV